MNEPPNHSDRRLSRRLKIDRSVRVPVQLASLIPFIGNFVEAGLINISEGGMALVLRMEEPSPQKMARGQNIKVHFHLPGRPLQECQAQVRHRFHYADGRIALGIRFTRIGQSLVKDLRRMAEDFENCERRIDAAGDGHPWCDVLCAFHPLCRKPLRVVSSEMPSLPLEIALQGIL
jgi:hypothetical protein